MIKLLYYLQLVRFQNIIIVCLSVMTTAIIIEKLDWYLISICIIQISCIMIFGNVMNDILDFKSDKINNPKRVLISKKITINEALLLCSLFFILSIVVSFFMNYKCRLLIYFYILPILILYNLYFKKKPIIGNIIVSSLLGIVFIFTELTLENKINMMIVPFILAFNLSFIREFIKDIYDSYGEFFFNIKTFPIVVGIKKSCVFISIYIFLSIFLFLIPYIIGLYNIKYLLSLIFLIEIPLIYSLFLLNNNPLIKTFRSLIVLHKFLTISGLFVIYLTKN